MTDTASTETMSVDLDGITITVPKAVGDQLIAKRQQAKESMRTAQEELGKVRAESAAAAEKARIAEQDKAALEHAKKGELDQVRQIMTRDQTEKLSRVSSRFVERAVEAELRKAGNVPATAIPDAVALLKSSVRYDFDADSVSVVDQAGQPLRDTTGQAVRVDAFIKGWIEQRPHLRLDTTPNGSGATGGAKPSAPGRISAKELRTATVEQLDAVAKGTLTVDAD